MKSGLIMLAVLSLNMLGQEWSSLKHTAGMIMFKESDKAEVENYRAMINTGIAEVKKFFGEEYKKEFTVYVHPGRASLDAQWQSDWKMPDFKSECWMVASGVGNKLDLLSPLAWQKEACEHSYTNKEETQKLITHELFHVYHGQQNLSPDFSGVQGLDWFVEGLATYASGQCDESRMRAVKESIKNKTAPTALDDFWKGKLKYGYSGSMVMYIDKKYGHEKLKAMLKFTTKKQVLDFLKISEEGLLEGWSQFILNNSKKE